MTNPQADPTTGPTPPPPPPPPGGGAAGPRQLRRRPEEGHIAGVCAGVADYFNIDPVIVRIAAAVLALSGPGIVAYILAWIFVPEADDQTPGGAGGHASHLGHSGGGHTDGHNRGGQIFGIVLLAIAVSMLWGWWWSPARRWFFPLALMGLGLWLILRRRDESGGPAPGLVDPWGSRPIAGHHHTEREPGLATAPTGRSGTDEPDGGDGGDTTTFDLSGGSPDDTAIAAGTWPTETGGSHGGPPGPPWGLGAWAAGDRPEMSPEARAARHRRRLVFPLVMGALLLWTGLAFLAGVSMQSGLAIALCIVGVGFVLGAFVGGCKLLVVPAILLGGALVMSSALDLPLRGPLGQRVWSPDRIEEVAKPFEVSLGEGRLDLRDLELTEGETHPIKASVGIGHLIVTVPAGVTVQVDARAGMGEIAIDGRPDSGVGVSTHRTIEGEASDTRIELELEVGMGQIEVRRARTGASIDDGSEVPTTATTAPGPR